MKTYEKPDFNIIPLENSDVLLASGDKWNPDTETENVNEGRIKLFN